jgi:hypothetical protein
MDTIEILSNQYLASLKMLENVITICPQPLWAQETDKNRFWHVAYHVLFYTHLYLHPDEASFKPWAYHRENYQFMGPVPWPPHHTPVIGEAYARQEILDFMQVCKQEVWSRLPESDLEATSGFSWLIMNKMELHLYNIRHLMLHTGELSDRLGTRYGMNVDWVVSSRD